MIWLYRLLYLPVLLLALPYYLIRMWRRGGYSKDFQHRFGGFHRLKANASGRKRIWIQAVSVGELLAVGPLMESLQQDNDVDIVLTTTTSTGYAEACKRYKDKVLSVGIFPLDFWLFSRMAWQRIRPDAILLTESELWPEHLHCARQRKIPAFLVNARMSDTSFRRYQRVGPLAAWLLKNIDHSFTASPLDRERLMTLGVPPDKVTCEGNIKFDAALPPLLDENKKSALKKELGFPANDFVLLGASTWPDEERILLEIQKACLESGIDCSLLLIPRHAERGSELARILANQGLAWHQRSKKPTPEQEIRIHLADTTGELVWLSQAADLAFIGKSLPPNTGGQTPIEAAGLGIPILMGPAMDNFKVVARTLLDEGAALQVPHSSELKAEVFRLLKAPAIREAMSRAGRQWHAKNKGSSERIAEHIRNCLQSHR